MIAVCTVAVPDAVFEMQVLSCLADLSELPAQPLLLTVTGRLPSAPQLKQKAAGGSIISMKIDDDSLQGNAAFTYITVAYMHNSDR